MPLAQFASQRSDAADGGAPPKIPAAAALKAAKAAARAASAGVAAKVQRHSQNEFKRLGIDLRKGEPSLSKQIDAWRAVNVERVTSLLEFERDELADILSKGWTKTVPELRTRIEERLEVSRSKADLLARDQVLTLNAQISHSRMAAAGITQAYWTTAKDERVRESHAEMDGELFDLDDPPEIDGERALPGEPIQCRCVSVPKLPELDDEPVSETSEGYAAEGKGPVYERELESKAVPDEIKEAGGSEQFKDLLSGISENDLRFLRTGYREPLKVLEGLSATEATKLTTGEAIPKGSKRPLPPIKVAIYPNDDGVVLVDGRHRMAAAQKAHASKIRARIIQYDDELNVLWEGDRIIKTPKKT